MRGPEYDSEVAEAHRALGEFIDNFQLMCARLRHGTAVLASGNGPAIVASRIELVLGEAGARMLSDGFFGVLRTYDHLSGDDRAALNALENETGQITTIRNELAHGDWLIGFGAGGDLPDYPRLLRIKAGRRTSDPAAMTDYSPQRVRELALDATRLAEGVLLATVHALHGAGGTIAAALPIVDGRVTPGWK